MKNKLKKYRLATLKLIGINYYNVISPDGYRIAQFRSKSGAKTLLKHLNRERQVLA